jgi:molybdopterin-guanine dinucleotide biosynthesis protein B
MSAPRVIGLAGWSGAGKTTLLVKAIPLIVGRGLRVATLKHAHHAFDVDQPGKDSFLHREAGASEVIISSSRRWAQIHEIGDDAEATLGELLQKVSAADLVIVEGFKRDVHAKIEVFRAANGREPMHGQDPRVLGVASDQPFPDAAVPVVPLDDVAAVVDLLIASAESLDATLARLQTGGADGAAR